MSYSNFISDFQPDKKRFLPHLGEVELKKYEIGKLVLTSGKVVACDPFVGLDTKPFRSNLKPGSYPVFLFVGHIKKNNNCRVAYAVLQLSQQTPVRWEMATRSGENLSSLKPEEKFVYGVDTGTGCFVDADTIRFIDEKSWEFEEDLKDQLEEALEKNFSPTWDWAVFTVDESTNANLAAFKTGWGDRCCASYFGYDAEDNIVNLVTDFNLFDRQLPGKVKEQIVSSSKLQFVTHS